MKVPQTQESVKVRNTASETVIDANKRRMSVQENAMVIRV
jgi:hypothetical protein